MALDELIATLSGSPRPIGDILREWQLGECDQMVRELSLLASSAAVAGSVTIFGDALRGGTTLMVNLKMVTWGQQGEVRGRARRVLTGLPTTLTCIAPWLQPRVIR